MKRSAANAIGLRRRLTQAGAALALAALPGLGAANPTGPSVVAGQASFSAQGSTFTITNTPGAIINWQGFSIARDELTRIQQQSAASSLLNRVTGGNPSEILGRLWSNGRVFLINPSGIAFGANARIDVAGLVASSLHISDADFIAGRLRFSGSGGEGRVVNQGEIAASVGGRVILLGPQVENAGLIRAPSGDIVLAAGSTVQLWDAGLPEIQVEISAPQDRTLPFGEAARSGNLFAYLVKQSGTLNASAAVAGDGGRIVLRSAGNAQIAAGSVTESGGRTGGAVRIEAAVVDVAPEAKILAGAVEQSNGNNAGNGGSVELLAERMRFAGEIEARGGTQGGDGGSVEVSGRQALVFTGSVDTRAPAGRDGSLLIDPGSIAIVPGSTGTPSGLADAAWTEAENPGPQRIGAADLAALLDTTSVTLQASERIELNADAQVNAAPIAERELTLSAREIVIHGSFRSSRAPLNLALNADTVRVAQGATLALGGGTLSVSASAVSVSQPQLTREAEQGMARAEKDDFAAMREQIDAEIARDNVRVVQALKVCGNRFADARQGCMVSTPPPKRFASAGV